MQNNGQRQRQRPLCSSLLMPMGLLVVLFLSGPALAQVTRVGAWTTGLAYTVGAGSDRLLLFMVGYANLSDDGVISWHPRY